MNLAQEIADLPLLTVAQLKARYGEVFGEPTNANHKTWLIKRIAWHLQAQAEGDLSERARLRTTELADEAHLRLSPSRPPRSEPGPKLPISELAPRETNSEAAPKGIPAPGGILTRPYKGRQLQVTVLAQGFAYEGKVYGSLSAVAKAITGSHCNGFLFFRLRSKGGQK